MAIQMIIISTRHITISDWCFASDTWLVFGMILRVRPVDEPSDKSLSFKPSHFHVTSFIIKIITIYSDMSKRCQVIEIMEIA